MFNSTSKNAKIKEITTYVIEQEGLIEMNEDMDIVIKEINQFFQIKNFKQVAINDRENFEHKGEYHKFTKSGENYYLECALTLVDAKLNRCEDIEAYSGRLLPATPNDCLQFHSIASDARSPFVQTSLNMVSTSRG